jgi:hypothetical protein
MGDSTLARQEDVAAHLASAGYELESRTLAGLEATIASNAYALIVCIEAGEWDGLSDFVNDAQADLTRLVEEAPSARNWDLYVVVVVADPKTDSERRAVIEKLESDTRYSRKFIHAGLPKADLDAALRPLLPLRAAADFAIPDPLNELRTELLATGVDERVVETALESFAADDEVRVP